jgi:hypothetical protein
VFCESVEKKGVAGAGVNRGFAASTVLWVKRRCVKMREKERFMADTKEHAYELIDRLAPAQLSAVVGLLEAMVDPGSLADAPEEEEEITPETAAALDRARASLARGEGIPHEEILREFGLDK